MTSPPNLRVRILTFRLAAPRVFHLASVISVGPVSASLTSSQAGRLGCTSTGMAGTGPVNPRIAELRMMVYDPLRALGPPVRHNHSCGSDHRRSSTIRMPARADDQGGNRGIGLGFVRQFLAQSEDRYP